MQEYAATTATAGVAGLKGLRLEILRDANAPSLAVTRTDGARFVSDTVPPRDATLLMLVLNGIVTPESTAVIPEGDDTVVVQLDVSRDIFNITRIPCHRTGEEITESVTQSVACERGLGAVIETLIEKAAKRIEAVEARVARLEKRASGDTDADTDEDARDFVYYCIDVTAVDTFRWQDFVLVDALMECMWTLFIDTNSGNTDPPPRLDHTMHYSPQSGEIVLRPKLPVRFSSIQEVERLLQDAKDSFFRKMIEVHEVQISYNISKEVQTFMESGDLCDGCVSMNR